MKRKEEKRIKRIEKHKKLVNFEGIHELDSSSDESSSVEEDFAVMSSKIKCKFTIKA